MAMRCCSVFQHQILDNPMPGQGKKDRPWVRHPHPMVQWLESSSSNLGMD